MADNDKLYQNISRLYQKIPRQTPSDMLDVRIRKQARQQLADRSPAPVIKRHGWQWLSVAAVMVLSVGVVLNILRQVPQEVTVEQVLQKAVTEEQETVRHEVGGVVEAEGQFAPAAVMPAPVMSDHRLKKQQTAPMPKREPMLFERNGIAPELDIAVEHPVDESMNTVRADSAEEPLCGIRELEGITDKGAIRMRFGQLKETLDDKQLKCLQKYLEQ